MHSANCYCGLLDPSFVFTLTLQVYFFTFFSPFATIRHNFSVLLSVLWLEHNNNNNTLYPYNTTG